MEKNYLVIGTSWQDEETHSIVGEKALHKTLEGARKELKNILDEITREAEEEGYDFEAEMNENQLILRYETGTEECFTIYERNLEE